MVGGQVPRVEEQHGDETWVGEWVGGLIGGWVGEWVDRLADWQGNAA